MTRPSILHDPVRVALEALNCPPDELAQLLGVDLRELNTLGDTPGQMSPTIRYRLASLLLQRASVLRRVAGNLTRRPTSARRAQLVATLSEGRARPRQTEEATPHAASSHSLSSLAPRPNRTTPLASAAGGTWYYAEPAR